MLPLCLTCSQDDGTSCYVCATCYRYAALSSGKYLLIKVIAIVKRDSIWTIAILIINIVKGVIQVAPVVLAHYNQTV